MGCGCYGGSRTRSFLTKKERVALLKEYQDELEKEEQDLYYYLIDFGFALSHTATIIGRFDVEPVFYHV